MADWRWSEDASVSRSITEEYSEVPRNVNYFYGFNGLSADRAVALMGCGANSVGYFRINRVLKVVWRLSGVAVFALR